jgi:predicted 2-oxoglutarate/Fe(II)-dependent dioxygenase YbiX/peroxiredoxin
MTDPTPLPPFKVPREPLAPGDRCPNFLLPDIANAFRAFYERVRGHPTALVFVPASDVALLDEFADAAQRFGDAGFDVFAVFGADVPDIKRESERLGGRLGLLADPKGAVTRGYATGARLNPQYAACYLMDANQRLLARNSADTAGSETLSAWAHRTLTQMAPAETVTHRSGGAPVLMLPLVLDPSMCRALIDRWERAGHQEGEVTSIVDGKEVTRVHDRMKRRRDHPIHEPEVLQGLAATVGRRIAPELVKAFHFEAFKFDRFNVTCYDSERGDYFRAHRDNESASTSERRFAMTLNLNTGEYEGGELLFPEYGPHRYAPPAGGAVIFSCSLLHEALPVTKGKRFTLLTFLSAVPAGARPAASASTQPAPSTPRGPASAPSPAGSGFNPGGFAPGAPAAGSTVPASKPAGSDTSPFAPGSAKNGLTRAGD